MSDPKAQYRTNAMSGIGTSFMTHHTTWAKVRQQSKSALFGMVMGIIIPTLALGQASLLPNAKQQYLDDSGNPVALGHVDYYVPSTLTRKTVWQDALETTPQANPVLLDAAGRPQPAGQTFGFGSYRQRVVDQNGITIWDAVTASTGSGGGTAPAFSEGVMVGTIIAWANPVLPAKYLYTAGQAISRASFPDLLTAMTFQQTILCQLGVATITVPISISDLVPLGTPIEASCFAPGTTVLSKASGSLTMTSNATATTSVVARLLPWGNGNGSTTFNVPDTRGRTVAGRDNMTSSIAGVLTSAFYGTNPDSINAVGGNQSHAVTLAEMPGHNHILTDPGHAHNYNAGSATNVQAGVNQANISTISTNATTTATTGISLSPNGGGIGVSATVATVGSGYTNGAQTITVAGGTCTTQPQFTVTVAGNVFTGVPVLLTAGSCTVTPTNPAATTGGGGTGGTLNVLYSANPISLVQPTITTDYIIKALPDDTPGGPGVSSIQGMTGAISCGTGVTCSAQTISVTLPGIVVGSTPITAGTNNGILYNSAGVFGNTPALTGDVTLAPATGITTLATVNAGVGTFGSATAAPVVTVNAKGLTTAITQTTMTPAIGSVTGLGTGVATAAAINTGSSGALGVLIARGTSALGTGAITSGTCATVVTTAATNTTTTDVVTASFNGDPTAITGYIPSTAGMLVIFVYPTANNVNFKVCNNTASSITPGAITLNWRVAR